MPFTRIQEALALATSVDTAMNRRDEIGMDMLRDLLPELREMIDDVNAALREVDELLFTGLRDEAITLNDPEFPRVAARLNLEDKSAWPEALAFFEAEGITPPPKLDFETLVALESAHTEVEALGRSLDSVRRLVLERAPLVTRLAVLRRLQSADGTKPVWAETIADHERARLAELPDAVRRALAAKDAGAIADLHAELVDPDWSVPVPKDLVRATRGADLWAALRDAVPAAEAAAAGLEAAAATAETGADPSVVATMRQARQAWYAASATVHECVAGLTDCPNVAALARAEGWEDRFAALSPRVGPALAWLEGADADEAALAQHAQAIAQIESYLASPPSTHRDEQPWLAGIGALERQVGGGMTEDLRARVTMAVAAVRRRPGRRTAVKAGIGAAVAVAALVGAVLVNGCVAGRRDHAADIRTLNQVLAAAESGAYDDVPDEVQRVADKYPGDEGVGQIVSEIRAAVTKEKARRDAVAGALDLQSRLLDEMASEASARRSRMTELEPWPDDLARAARAWREARAAGGDPAKRGKGAGSMPAEQAAATILRAEEDRIEAGRERQESSEKQFTSHSKLVFQARLDAVRQKIAAVPAAAGPEVFRAIRAEVDALREQAQAKKIGDPDALLAAPTAELVSPVLVKNLDALQADLDARATSTPAPDTGGDP